VIRTKRKAKAGQMAGMGEVLGGSWWGLEGLGGAWWGLKGLGGACSNQATYFRLAYNPNSMLTPWSRLLLDKLTVP